jgi:DNA-binding NarL/FixJ family response regulator
LTGIAVFIALAVLAVVGGLATAGFILKRKAAHELSSSLKADTPNAPHSAARISVSEVIEGNEEEKAPQEAGNEKRVKRRKITKRVERKIIEMYRSGKSPKEIARTLGVSTSTVYRRVRNAVGRKAAST